MIPASFDYAAPGTLEEAFAGFGNWKKDLTGVIS